MDGCHPAGLIRAPQRFAPASSACEHRLMHLLDDRPTAHSVAATPAAVTRHAVLRCGAGLADAFSTSAHHGPGGGARLVRRYRRLLPPERHRASRDRRRRAEGPHLLSGPREPGERRVTSVRWCGRGRSSHTTTPRGTVRRRGSRTRAGRRRWGRGAGSDGWSSHEGQVTTPTSRSAAPSSEKLGSMRTATRYSGEGQR